MIILSQDRNSIVNYDNVKSIWITVMDKSEHDKDAKFFIVADSEILGGYDTEERAKEVLQEIIDMYIQSNEELRSTGYGYVRNTVYEIPRD